MLNIVTRWSDPHATHTSIPHFGVSSETQRQRHEHADDRDTGQDPSPIRGPSPRRRARARSSSVSPTSHETETAETAEAVQANAFPGWQCPVALGPNISVPPPLKAKFLRQSLTFTASNTWLPHNPIEGTQTQVTRANLEEDGTEKGEESEEENCRTTSSHSAGKSGANRKDNRCGEPGEQSEANTTCA